MPSATREFVDAYLRETAEIALGTSRDDLTRVIDVLFDAWKNDRTIYTCGNGGSAANASHLACDISKFTWCEGKKRFKCHSLCDNAALISALTNDVGFNRIFLEQLEGRVAPGDVLVCLSVHGGSGADKAGPWSQNLVAAADFAKKKGARVVALVGYDGGALRQMADASIIVPRTESGHTSTPHVEGFHEIYHHMICERLRQMVAEAEA
ncbi:D-sedoheptulose-7-phosphate isomerase [Polyangium aurulentum]|uniref:D-sedoheptulose-7-phosphate isomerase n=1 Tax=Polyangium aurulentum TaxID=2567896 RepID=UPI0010AE9D04|nr:SIS domain-containing protein [Polyangium aurulentum]UQA56322.1 SIS domain-containing protein [Polyangium aurulentum]